MADTRAGTGRQTVAGNASGWAHVTEYAGGSGTVAGVTARYLDRTLSGTPSDYDTDRSNRVNQWLVEVIDGKGGSARATLPIPVNNVPDSPRWMRDPAPAPRAKQGEAYLASIADFAVDSATRDPSSTISSLAATTSQSPSTIARLRKSRDWPFPSRIRSPRTQTSHRLPAAR